jgi:hypothetical protein
VHRPEPPALPDSTAFQLSDFFPCTHQFICGHPQAISQDMSEPPEQDVAKDMLAFILKIVDGEDVGHQANSRLPWINRSRSGGSDDAPHFTEDISGTADDREFAVVLDDTSLALKKIENRLSKLPAARINSPATNSCRPLRSNNYCSYCTSIARNTGTVFSLRRMAWLTFRRSLSMARTTHP